MDCTNLTKGLINGCALLLLSGLGLLAAHAHAAAINKTQHQAQVRMLHGAPALFVDGQPTPPFAYMSYLGKEPYYREMASAGVHLYCLPAYLGERGINIHSGIGPFRRGLWREENEFDFTSLSEDFAALQRADPQGLIIIRLHLDPPEWWEKAHPQDCAQLADGGTLRQCFASPAWRQATADALRTVLRWIQSSPQAGNVVGIHVAAGGTEEWVYHYMDTYQDNNPARAAAFRSWLGQAYAHDPAKLRQAWGMEQIDFSNAPLPTLDGSQEPARWRDPLRERPTLDMLRFQSQVLTDDIAYFCRVVKEESGGRWLTGAFYGYHWFLGDARKGHNALGRLLDCPDLDYLSSPNAYKRVLGEDWPPMAATASIALHGKLWMAENDTRTYKTTLLKEQAPQICPAGAYEQGVWLGPDSAADSVALLRKNAARMLAGGYGGWWFDMWGGWFAAPDLMEVIQRTQQLSAQDIREQPPAMPAQVAVVADEELCFYDTTWGVQTEQVNAIRYNLAKAGAPYDLYLRSDLAHLPENQYKVIWLLGLQDLKRAEERWSAQQTAAGVTLLQTDVTRGTVLIRPGQPAELLLDGFDTAQLTPARLRELWRAARVHLYVDSDDVLYAGRGWVALHSEQRGARTVSLPFAAHVSDAWLGQELEMETSHTLKLTLPPRSSTLLRLTPMK